MPVELVPRPLSPNAIGLITITLGLCLPLVAALVCWKRRSVRTKAIAGAWLCYGFTACPLFLLCVNAVLTLGHAQMGTPIQAHYNYGVGEPALAFSAGYAILHLTSDLAQNLREPEPVS